MSKIQALQSDYLSPVFLKQVLPVILENNVPVARSKSLSLLDVFSSDFEAAMERQTPDLAFLDFRHWYYPDDKFDEYIQRVAEFNLPAVCIGESPYGFERPSCDITAYEHKLYKRMKRASDILRLKSPSTTIVSPAISIVDPTLQENYLDFFIHNRGCFDVYSVHCVYDLKEQIAGLLTAFLNQVLHALPKPVWVTQWAVPSCEHSIENSMSITMMDWKPSSHAQAAQSLRSGFRSIEEVAGKNTKWFFTGLDRDQYVSTGRIPNFWDGYAYRNNPADAAAWDARHFLGAVDYQGNIKMEVLESLFEIVKNNEQKG